MEQLLAAEEKFNRDLLAPLFAIIRDNNTTCTKITSGSDNQFLHYHEGKWWRRLRSECDVVECDEMETMWRRLRPEYNVVECDEMETMLLERLRLFQSISAWGDSWGFTSLIRVPVETAYLCVAIKEYATGFPAGPTAGRAFLSWEDHHALYRQVLDERRMRIRELGIELCTIDDRWSLSRAESLVECSGCWLRRFESCEAVRSHVLFPAQLELGESVCELNQNEE
ncbi:hypothetical protein QKT49_gp233 [Acanthamoeba castellanii medusavirus]|uniref:Uncharacterized protein n=1 Tax=Acanthamoeba castellanii medusavirus J1 TaxID=3114988 RepID=A0A3T1CXH1_9VIRU|nr:hypothetical protein QKT49_gp233 [Acanthamoeba castellanii medusavirus]BBI30530.1 hypothetical protein [Acanthamoeba castellanii medusavirus J1]